jgi:hypothetical protein
MSAAGVSAALSKLKGERRQFNTGNLADVRTIRRRCHWLHSLKQFGGP